jgi:hypothetical protein
MVFYTLKVSWYMCASYQKTNIDITVEVRRTYECISLNSNFQTNQSFETQRTKRFFLLL